MLYCAELTFAVLVPFVEGNTGPRLLVDGSMSFRNTRRGRVTSRTRNLGDMVDKLVGLQVESVGEFADYVQGGYLLTAFNDPYGVAVQIRLFS